MTKSGKQTSSSSSTSSPGTADGTAGSGSTAVGSTTSSRGRGIALLQRLRQRRELSDTGSESSVGSASTVVEKKLATELGRLTTIEEELGAAKPETMPSQTSKETKLTAKVERPAPILRRGTGGRDVNVGTNYVRLELDDGNGIFEYQVEYTPEVETSGAKFALINQHRDVLGGSKMFDGKQLFIPKRLPEDKTMLKSQLCTDGDEGGKKEYVVVLSYAGKKPVGDSTCLRLYNILFQRVFSLLGLAMVRTGTNRSHFDPSNSQVLERHGLEIWPGYSVSVDEMEGGILLHCDTSNRVMRTRTVLDIITDIFTKNKDAYQEEAKKQLVGSYVVTRYNNRTYKVDDIDFEMNPKSEFIDHLNNSVSFEDYYRNAYKIDLKDLGQPMLVHLKKMPGPDADPIKITLVPELCFAVGLTDAQRADFRVMKDVADFTRQSAEKKLGSVHDLIGAIKKNESVMKLLDGWGLRLADKSFSTDARVMPPVTLEFGNGYTESVGPRGDWSRAATTKHVLSPRPLHNWTVVIPSKDESTAKSFVDMVRQQAKWMGISVWEPKVVTLRNDRTENFLKAIEELPDDTQMAVTIFSGPQRTDRYAAIKKMCYLDRGLNNQVIMQKNLANEKKMRTICSKVLLQMNCKLGGELWGCNVPIDSLMVIGMDVYRDKVGGRSVAGIVTTLNGSFGKYWSQVVFENKEDRKKFTEEVSRAICDSVKRYADSNDGVLPEKIVIYRDGVNAGQYAIAKKEAIALCEAIKEAYTAPAGAAKPVPHPSIAIVVVQKKVKTKFFLLDAGTVQNPCAGTVLDHDITRRDLYDFYLVPMNVNQGTVTPTHFIVVHESLSGGAGMKPSTLQRLSYALTHMYFNWPGNVKVPAPCQYAHKLVAMVGDHLHKEAHRNMNGKLFYL